MEAGALPLNVFREFALRHRDVHWLYQRCYMCEHKSVTCHQRSYSAVADTFRPLISTSSLLKLSGELHISKVLLIASTLLVVKAENIYRKTRKVHINHGNKVLPLNSFQKLCSSPCHRDVHWLHHSTDFNESVMSFGVDGEKNF